MCGLVGGNVCIVTATKDVTAIAYWLFEACCFLCRWASKKACVPSIYKEYLKYNAGSGLSVGHI